LIWVLVLFVALAGVGAWLVSKSTTVRVIAVVAALLAAGTYWLVGKPGMSDQPLARRVAELEKRSTDPAQASQMRMDEVIALLKSRAEKNPKDPAPHFSLAQIYDILGKQTDAQLAYQEGLRRAPEFTKRMEMLDKLSPQQLAEALQKGEMQTDEVIGLLEYRAWQSPGDPGPRLALAGLYEQINRPEQARMSYEAALARQPDNPKALAKLAGIMFRSTGQLDAEIAGMYRKSYAKDPTDPAVGIMVALDEWNQGRKPEAEQMWAAILAKVPPNDPLRTMYGVIRQRFAPADGAAPGPGGPPAKPD
jgi:cytochrome c-type biogenesis protein CcmH/NrfG